MEVNVQNHQRKHILSRGDTQLKALRWEKALHIWDTDSLYIPNKQGSDLLHLPVTRGVLLIETSCSQKALTKYPVNDCQVNRFGQCSWSLVKKSSLEWSCSHRQKPQHGGLSHHFEASSSISPWHPTNPLSTCFLFYGLNPQTSYNPYLCCKIHKGRGHFFLFFYGPCAFHMHGIKKHLSTYWLNFRLLSP